MNIWKRRMMYVLMNGTFLIMLMIAILQESEGAKNVALFMAWGMAIISPFSVADDCVKHLAKHGRSMPAWLDISFDLFVCGFMLWHGWIYTGIAYSLHTAFMSAAWSKAEELRGNA